MRQFKNRKINNFFFFWGRGLCSVKFNNCFKILRNSKLYKRCLFYNLDGGLWQWDKLMSEKEFWAELSFKQLFIVHIKLKIKIGGNKKAGIQNWIQKKKTKLKRIESTKYFFFYLLRIWCNFLHSHKKKQIQIILLVGAANFCLEEIVSKFFCVSVRDLRFLLFVKENIFV